MGQKKNQRSNLGAAESTAGGKQKHTRWSLSGGAAQEVSGGGGAMPRSTKLPAFSLHLSQPIPALRSLSLSVYSLVWSVEPALLRRSAKKKGCVLGQGAQ